MTDSHPLVFFLIKREKNFYQWFLNNEIKGGIIILVVEDKEVNQVKSLSS